MVTIYIYCIHNYTYSSVVSFLFISNNGMFKFQQVLDSLSKRLKKKENAIMSEKTNELKRSRTCAW